MPPKKPKKSSGGKGRGLASKEPPPGGGQSSGSSSVGQDRNATLDEDQRLFVSDNPSLLESVIFFSRPGNSTIQPGSTSSGPEFPLSEIDKPREESEAERENVEDDDVREEQTVSAFKPLTPPTGVTTRSQASRASKALSPVAEEGGHDHPALVGGRTTTSELFSFATGSTPVPLSHSLLSEIGIQTSRTRRLSGGGPSTELLPFGNSFCADNTFETLMDPTLILRQDGSTEGDGSTSGGDPDEPDPGDGPGVLHGGHVDKKTFTKLLFYKLFQLVQIVKVEDRTTFVFVYLTMNQEEFQDIFDNRFQKLVLEHLHTVFPDWTTWYTGEYGTLEDTCYFTQDDVGLKKLGKILHHLTGHDYPWDVVLAEMLEADEDNFLTDSLHYFAERLEDVFYYEAEGVETDVISRPVFGNDTRRRDVRAPAWNIHCGTATLPNPVYIFGYLLEHCNNVWDEWGTNDKIREDIEAVLTAMQFYRNWLHSVLTNINWKPFADTKTDNGIRQALDNWEKSFGEIFRLEKIIKDQHTPLLAILVSLFHVPIGTVETFADVLEIPTIDVPGVFLVLINQQTVIGIARAATTPDGPEEIVDESLEKALQTLGTFRQTFNDALHLQTQLTGAMSRTFRARTAPARQNHTFASQYGLRPLGTTQRRTPTPPAVTRPPQASRTPSGPGLATRTTGSALSQSAGPAASNSQSPPTPPPVPPSVSGSTQPPTQQVPRDPPAQSGIGTQPPPGQPPQQAPGQPAQSGPATQIPPGQPPPHTPGPPHSGPAGSHGSSAPPHAGSTSHSQHDQFLHRMNNVTQRFIDSHHRQPYSQPPPPRRLDRPDRPDDSAVITRAHKILTEAVAAVNDEGSVGTLEFLLSDLKSTYDAVVKVSLHGTSLPRVQLMNSEGTLDVMLRTVSGRLQDRIRSINNAAKDARETQKTLRDKLQRNLPDIKLPELKGQHTFLRWHKEVTRFMSQNGEVQDNNAYFYNMLYSTLSEENKKCISSQKQSIEYLVHLFTDKYQTNITESVVRNYVETLKHPVDSLQVSHNNITTILDIISLIKDFHGDTASITLPHIHAMEKKAFTDHHFNVYLDELVGHQQQLNVNPNLNDTSMSASFAGTRLGERLNTGVSILDVQHDNDHVVNLGRRAQATMMAPARLELFVRYSERKVGQIDLMLAQDGASTKQRSAGATNHVHQTETMEEQSCYWNNSNASGKEKKSSSNWRGPPRRSQPELPCPLKSLGCNHRTKSGTAFHCDEFRKHDKVERQALCHKNSLCLICLQAAHPKGVQCPYIGYKCSYCKEVGVHNRRSGLCPAEPEQRPGQTCQFNQADGDGAGDQNREDEDQEVECGYYDELMEEFNSHNYHMTEQHPITAVIETEIEEFWSSLVGPGLKPGEPEVAPEEVPAMQAAISDMERAIVEARKTGVTEDQQQQDDILCMYTELSQLSHYSRDFNFMMTASQTEQPDVREENIFTSQAKKLNLTLSDVVDMMSTKYPGAIFHESRPLQEKVHLQVGPQSTGAEGKMFQQLYNTSTQLYNISPVARMQNVPVALLIQAIFLSLSLCHVNIITIQDPAAFPNNHTELEDSYIVVEGTERYLVCEAMLDTGLSCFPCSHCLTGCLSGCSLVMGSSELIKHLQPPRMRKYETNVTTGNGKVVLRSRLSLTSSTIPGVIMLKDFMYEFCLKTQCERNPLVKLVGSVFKKPLGIIPGVPPQTKAILKEEFRMTDELLDQFNLPPSQKRPQMLIGVNFGHVQARRVNPLALDCRPNLWNPSLHFFETDISYKKKYGVFGSFGTDPDLYNLKHNTPSFYLQQANVDQGRILPWQSFSPSLLVNLQEKASVHNEELYVHMNTHPSQPGRTPSGLDAHLPDCLDHIAEMAETHAKRDEACMLLATCAQEDSANINLAEAKFLERWIETESGFSHIIPVCRFHEKTWENVVKNCRECQTSNDGDAERKRVLAKNIEDNLHIVPHPDNDGKPEAERQFTFVQKLVTQLPHAQMGHLAVSNFPAAKKATQKLIKKHQGTEILATLSKQHRAYLESDKFRVVSTEVIRDISAGRTPAQFYCKAAVFKPDSLSTPARLIADTARLVWGTLNSSLASNSPSPTGDTRCSPSAVIINFQNFQVILLICPRKSVDFLWRVSISRLTFPRPVSSNTNTTNTYTTHFSLITDHSVRLHQDDFYMFCSVWCLDPEQDGSKFLFIVHNVMSDFGMVSSPVSTPPITHSPVVCQGSAHMSLWSAVRKSSTFCRLPDTARILLRNLFVDNIGITGEKAEEMFETLWDVVDTLRRFGLHIDKIFCPHAIKDASSRDFETPNETVTLGLIWLLEEDEVLPRIKLSWFGTDRGRPTGPPLEETNIFLQTLTRRVFARLMSQLYDLLGRFLGIAVAQVKLRCKKLIAVTSGMHLDTDIASVDSELDTEIKTFWTALKHLQTEIKPLPRTVVPHGSTLQYVTICHDASPLMVASVAHAVSADTSGNLQSRILGSKSSLNSSSVPRNEKLSQLQAVEVLLTVVKSLDQEWLTNRTAWVLGDSTIASFLFQGSDYNGDGHSRAIFIKINAVLTVISKIMPDMVVKFCWLTGPHVSCADLLTKEIPARSIIPKLNSEVWRAGSPALLQPSLLERFKFFEWSGSAGTYSALPDYLRKAKSYEAAVLIHLAVVAPDQPSLDHVLVHQSEQPAAPQENENILLYLFAKPGAVSTFINNVVIENLVETKETINDYLIMTRAGRLKQKSDFSSFQPKLDTGMLTTGTATVGQWDRQAKTWSTGITGNYETREVTTKTIKVKVKDETLPSKKRTQPGDPVPVSRLSADCYTSASMLHNTANIKLVLMEPYESVSEYLTDISRKETLHATVNVLAAQAYAALSWKEKTFSITGEDVIPEEVFLAIWIRLLRSDQKFFPPAFKDNLHQEYKVYFNKYAVEDEYTEGSMPSLNLPILAPTSPLLLKAIQSSHKSFMTTPRAAAGEEDQVTYSTVHSSIVRTLSILTTGFFALTSTSLKAVTTTVLALCTGCCRSKPRFYQTRMGPRYVGRQLGRGAWNRISFDEVGPALVCRYAGARGMIKIWFYVFCCLDSRAVCIIPSFKIDGATLAHALQHFCYRTGAQPRQCFCDNYSTHSGAAITSIGQIAIKPHVSGAKHRNYVEAKVKEVKKYLRAIAGNQKEEPTNLGSLTIFDVTYTLDLISYCLNTTPVNSESSLTPAMIVWPGVINKLGTGAQLEGELYDDFGSVKSARAADKLLDKYREIILAERTKNLLAIQRQHDSSQSQRLHHVKKGQRSMVEPEENDIVLVDYNDGQKFRLGRIVSLNTNKTTAEVAVSGKKKEVAVNNLRILSIFRN